MKVTNTPTRPGWVVELRRWLITPPRTTAMVAFVVLGGIAAVSITELYIHKPPAPVAKPAAAASTPALELLVPPDGRVIVKYSEQWIPPHPRIRIRVDDGRIALQTSHYGTPSAKKGEDTRTFDDIKWVTSVTPFATFSYWTQYP